jgi:H+/Cl- antiporter ClcA
MRSRQYLRVLLLAAALGVPISAGAYWILWAVTHGQHLLFEWLPTALGFTSAPAWWPLPCLAMGGLLTGAAIHYLPGRGGHSPVDGFQAGGPPPPAALPGVLLAMFGSLCFGAVLGPEGPLIALGSGLAALVLRVRKFDATDKEIAVVGITGAFAAIAFLFGSPIVGALFMLGTVGLAGSKAKIVLVPGLLCSGIGFLVAVGINTWTGIGKVSLTISDVPAYAHPQGPEFLWAVGFGVGAAVLGSAIRRLGLLVRSHIEGRALILTPVAGLVVAALALLYTQITDNATSDVLFSGEETLPKLVRDADTYPVGTLVLLLLCKGVGYSISVGSFRGGMIFPAICIGGTAGILFSHLPGLPVTAGIAMGMGAMAAVMLRMPMAAVLLASLLLGSEGIRAMPLIIVAVVVAFVATAWLEPVGPPAAQDHGDSQVAATSSRAEEKVSGVEEKG